MLANHEPTFPSASHEPALCLAPREVQSVTNVDCRLAVCCVLCTDQVIHCVSFNQGLQQLYAVEN